MPPFLQSEYLHRVNELINERLGSIPSLREHSASSDMLKLACSHLCISEHAKRARPLLCLYYHWMFSSDVADNFINIGVAAEFIHAASLLHDDVIDAADKRRGKSAAHHVYGNPAAVLAGDYLLTEAFELLRPFDRVLSERAIDTIREMTKAAILELDARGNVDISFDALCTIAKGKTGILFSWCGFAAGFFCDNLLAAEVLWEAGARIGLIFQLADDIKDFDGDHNLKDVCRDIRNLEPSMPIILAVNRDENIKQLFRVAYQAQEISENEAMKLREVVLSSGAIEEARRIMSYEYEMLLEKLAIFKDNPGRAYLDQFVAELVAYR